MSARLFSRLQHGERHMPASCSSTEMAKVAGTFAIFQPHSMAVTAWAEVRC